jgi:hypothetical protein
MSDIETSTEEIVLGVFVIPFIVFFLYTVYRLARNRNWPNFGLLLLALALLLLYILFFQLYGRYNNQDLIDLAAKDQNTFRVKIGNSTAYQTVSAEAAEAAANKIFAIKRKSYFDTLKNNKAVTPFLEALNEQYKTKEPLGQVVEYTSITPAATTSAYRRAQY